MSVRREGPESESESEREVAGPHLARGSGPEGLDAAHHILQELRSLGCFPSEAWVRSWVQQARARAQASQLPSPGDLGRAAVELLLQLQGRGGGGGALGRRGAQGSRSVPGVGELVRGCLASLLSSDFHAIGAAAFPTHLARLREGRITGQILVQADEITDVGAPMKQRFGAPCQAAASESEGPSSSSQPASAQRCLKLLLTDGQQQVAAFEYRPVPALHRDLPAGVKVVLKDAPVRRGMVLLVPEAVTVLGGQVPHLEAARQRLLSHVSSLFSRPSRIAQQLQERRRREQQEGRQGQSRPEAGLNLQEFIAAATAAAWEGQQEPGASQQGAASPSQQQGQQQPASFRQENQHQHQEHNHREQRRQQQPEPRHQQGVPEPQQQQQQHQQQQQQQQQQQVQGLGAQTRGLPSFRCPQPTAGLQHQQNPAGAFPGPAFPQAPVGAEHTRSQQDQQGPQAQGPVAAAEAEHRDWSDALRVDEDDLEDIPDAVSLHWAPQRSQGPAGSERGGQHPGRSLGSLQGTRRSSTERSSAATASTWGTGAAASAAASVAASVPASAAASVAASVAASASARGPLSSAGVLPGAGARVPAAASSSPAPLVSASALSRSLRQPVASEPGSLGSSAAAAEEQEDEAGQSWPEDRMAVRPGDSQANSAVRGEGAMDAGSRWTGAGRAAAQSAPAQGTPASPAEAVEVIDLTQVSTPDAGEDEPHAVHVLEDQEEQRADEGRRKRRRVLPGGAAHTDSHVDVELPTPAAGRGSGLQGPAGEGAQSRPCPAVTSAGRGAAQVGGTGAVKVPLCYLSDLQRGRGLTPVPGSLRPLSAGLVSSEGGSLAAALQQEASILVKCAVIGVQEYKELKQQGSARLLVRVYLDDGITVLPATILHEELDRIRRGGEEEALGHCEPTGGRSGQQGPASPSIGSAAAEASSQGRTKKRLQTFLERFEGLAQISRRAEEDGFHVVLRFWPGCTSMDLGLLLARVRDP